MTDLKMTISTTRPATAEEVDDMVFGTGALTLPWWLKVTTEGSGYRILHDTEVDPEGTFKGNTFVTRQDILDAAATFLAEGRGGEDAREALTESIGYLDASAADDVLQRAVFGKAIFG